MKIRGFGFFRYPSDSCGKGSTTLHNYDNFGNLISKSTGVATSETFEYDALNRLAKYTSYNGSTTTYKYDPFGRRIEKSSPEGVKKYLWDGIKIICEYDDTDTLTDKLTYGNNREILSRHATITVGTTTTTADYFYHHNHLGSVVMITNSTGAIVNTYNYDDFGSVIDANECIFNDFTYNGSQFNKENNTYYYTTGYYDSNSGRFFSKYKKPGELVLPLRLNNYTYHSVDMDSGSDIDDMSVMSPSGIIGVAIIAMIGTAILLGLNIYYRIREKEKKEREAKEQ